MVSAAIAALTANTAHRRTQPHVTMLSMFRSAGVRNFGALATTAAAEIHQHPAGSLKRAFLFAGAAVKVLGSSAPRSVGSPRAWYRFPRHVAGIRYGRVRRHHVRFCCRQRADRRGCVGRKFGRAKDESASPIDRGLGHRRTRTAHGWRSAQ